MWYVVDTNLLSEPGKPNPDERVVSWLREMRPTCVVAAITLAELRYGLERLPESRRSRALSRLLDRLLEDLERRILPFDEEVAVEWGRYAAECEAAYGSGWMERVDIRDSLIAATARAHGFAVATRNDRHFPFCRTINPWRS